MTSLMHRNYQIKISVSACKCLSSLAGVDKKQLDYLISSVTGVVKNPLDFPDGVETNLNYFKPFHFFDAYTKSKKCTIRDTKMVHAHLVRMDVLHRDIFVTNSLMGMYCKSAFMNDALKLFDEIPNSNDVSWNIIISGYNSNFLFEDSRRIFRRMRLLGYNPNEFTYGSILSACTALQSPLSGKQVYALALKDGFYSNGHVRAGMIDLFAKNCTFDDALRVFHDVSCENVVCWNAIISGAVKNEENQVALDLFCQMCGVLVPNRFTFSSILTACAQLKKLEMGQGVQGWVIKCGAEEDVFVGTAIVDLYAKCGKMDDAVQEFLWMPIRNVVSWTTIISCFVKKDDSISALQFFKEMKKNGEEINNYTITSILTACSKSPMFKEATQIHSWIVKTGFHLDSVVRASLINMYSKIGAVDYSEMLFRESDNIKDLSIWATMIFAFTQNESSQKAIELFQGIFQEGLKPDKFCSSSILSIVDCRHFGREIHCYTLKTGLDFDVSVGSSLFTMYSKCGSIEESYEVFEQMPYKDNVSWASMIAGFAEHGCPDHAVHLFREMLHQEVRPDEMTFTAILKACSGLHSLQKGKEVHGYSIRAGVGKEKLISGALVTMYSRCGALDIAARVFDMMPQKDPVSCSSLVSGYAHYGFIEEALLLFHEIRMANLGIDSVTISSVLGAAALLNKSGIGTELHALVTKMGLDSEVSVGSSLLKMYSKCGGIEDCCKVFDQIVKPDLITWTAMIGSYAQHGKAVEALSLYNCMKEEGIKPDSVTFVEVLSACSHCGLVEDGYFHLNSMTKEYGIEPGNRHYACMVDLLGRSGRLKEAEKFINNMLVEPDALVWGTLLAACKVHGDIELGKLAAKKVFELKPCDSGAYVSLSNIWADLGQWEEVQEIRGLMKGTGVRKEPGWSFV